jgi:hypothetical protein
MRSDMATVIVERPRFGSSSRGKSKGYLRSLQRMGQEGLPAREGMKRRHQGHTKSLNEHLGPLRRYLDSQVGRPWNKVFSEICAHIDRSSAVQDHVRDHVADYVATHVLEIDGEPCHGAGFWYGRPLREIGWSHWYVCPRSGILKRVKPRKRSQNRRPKPPDAPRFVRVSDSLQCRLIDGVWHVVSLQPLPLPQEGKNGPEWDVVLDQHASQIDFAMARKNYGDLVFASGKRRLARRELAQFPIPFELWR